MKLWHTALFEGEGGDGGGNGGGAPAPAPAPAPTGGQTLLGGSGSGDGGASPAPPVSGWTRDDSGSFTEGWYGRLDGELKDNASLKVIGSVSDLAKAYVETKRLVGTKLEAPTDKSTPEQVAAWRKTVGAPEKPEGYLGEKGSIRPEAIPESMWDKGNEKALLDVAHKHHLSPAALQDILGVYASQVEGSVQSLGENEAAYVQAQMGELKKSWGSEFEANLSLASRVAQTVGLSKDHPIFTSAEVVQAFGKLGKMFSESSLVSGETSSSVSGGLTARISEITDPKSTATLAREYRGEFGPERQQQAAETYRGLLKAQQEQRK